MHKFDGVAETVTDGVRTVAWVCTCGETGGGWSTERAARDAHQDHMLGAYRNRDATADRITANMGLLGGPEPAL